MQLGKYKTSHGVILHKGGMVILSILSNVLPSMNNTKNYDHYCLVWESAVSTLAIAFSVFQQFLKFFIGH